MELVLAIIVCIGLYTTNAHPTPEENKPTFEQLIRRGYASELRNRMCPKYLTLLRWNDLRRADEVFKKKCIAALPGNGGVLSSTADEAFYAVYSQIKILLQQDYELFLGMASSSPKGKIHLQNSLSYLLDADEDFKENCIAEFVSKCGKSRKNLDKNKNDKATCKAAYDTLESQLKIFVDDLDLTNIPIPSKYSNILEDFKSDLLCSKSKDNFLKFFGKWFKIKKADDAEIADGSKEKNKKTSENEITRKALVSLGSK